MTHWSRCKMATINYCILFQTSLKSVHKGHINNNPALVQIMTCQRRGDNSLFEQMMALYMLASLGLDESSIVHPKNYIYIYIYMYIWLEFCLLWHWSILPGACESTLKKMCNLDTWITKELMLYNPNKANCNKSKQSHVHIILEKHHQDAIEGCNGFIRDIPSNCKR